MPPDTPSTDSTHPTPRAEAPPSAPAPPESAAPAATAPPADAELRALLAEARARGDERVCRLVTSYVTLRRVTADVVAFVAAREGGAAVASTPLLLRARELTEPSSR